MALFSRFRKRQSSNYNAIPPELPTAEEAEETPIPVDAQHEELKAMLHQVLKNQDVIDYNVRLVISKLNTLQEDMGTCIRNELILGKDQDELIKDTKLILRLINK